jgi:hypothetical protein
VDDDAARTWFDGYLQAFAAFVRHEDGGEDGLLACYSVPLLVTFDAGVRLLASEADVVTAIAGHVEGARAAGYARSEVLSAEVARLNGSTTLLRADLSRRRADGTEIGRLRASYLLVAAPGEAPRIAALVFTDG